MLPFISQDSLQSLHISVTIIMSAGSMGMDIYQSRQNKQSLRINYSAVRQLLLAGYDPVSFNIQFLSAEASVFLEHHPALNDHH